MADQSAIILRRQLRELQKTGSEGFSVGLIDDDIYNWEVLIIGPPDTLYEGGFFKATLVFPKDYPLSPPKMKFITPGFWHPNVYETGEVCISILHPPGDDDYGYEAASERWLPVHSVESILLSVISMLSSPNDESAANVAAAKEWRDNPKEYKKRVGRLVRRTIEEGE